MILNAFEIIDKLFTSFSIWNFGYFKANKLWCMESEQFYEIKNFAIFQSFSNFQFQCFRAAANAFADSEFVFGKDAFTIKTNSAGGFKQ